MERSDRESRRLHNEVEEEVEPLMSISNSRRTTDHRPRVGSGMRQAMDRAERRLEQQASNKEIGMPRISRALHPISTTSNVMAHESEIVRRITSTIHDRVGRTLPYSLDEVKHVKPLPPKPYGGEDDIAVFEKWIAELLRYYRVTGMTGPDKD